VSASENTGAGTPGQPVPPENHGQFTPGDASAALVDLKRAELQLQLGILSRQSLLALFKIGDATLKAWERAGLTPISKGARQLYYKRQAIERFLTVEPRQPKGKQT
jgi:hypothetical protein